MVNSASCYNDDACQSRDSELEIRRSHSNLFLLIHKVLLDQSHLSPTNGIYRCGVLVREAMIHVAV